MPESPKVALNKTYTSNNPFKRVLNAYKYSKQGLKSAYTSEQAFRQDLALVACHCLLAVWLIKNHWVLILFLIAGINLLVAELVNTAIEYVVDRIGTEPNELSGKAKDVGSAIVLLTLLNLVILWLGWIAFG